MMRIFIIREVGTRRPQLNRMFICIVEGKHKKTRSKASVEQERLADQAEWSNHVKIGYSDHVG